MARLKSGELRTPHAETFLSRTLFSIVALIGLCLQSGNVAAQAYESRSNARLSQLQAKVNQLYEDGKHERAYLIYRDELAAAGDKYAQYMIGYMTMRGESVEQDPITASAWYRLAAERGTPQFVMVRDEVLATFDSAQRQESDSSFLQLRKHYGDVALLLEQVRIDLKNFATAPGPAAKVGSTPSVIVDRRTGLLFSADYYQKIRERLRTRLSMLARLTRIENFPTDPDELEFSDIEPQVSAWLDRLE